MCLGKYIFQVNQIEEIIPPYTGYHLADLVAGIPSNTNETYFIVAKTGEQLKWRLNLFLKIIVLQSDIRSLVPTLCLV
jgi:hypothetical protein